MNGRLAAQHAACELDGAIGDHLVRVHVRLRAGARLEHAERELAIEPAIDDLLRRAHDQVDLLRRQHAEPTVRNGGALLHDAEGAYDRAPPAEAIERNGEIQERALRLRAP